MIQINSSWTLQKLIAPINKRQFFSLFMSCEPGLFAVIHFATGGFFSFKLDITLTTTHK